jgi:hypothetical protein
METYLSSAAKQFSYYKSLAEKTLEQISDDSLFRVASPESNSISVIVQHLHGNMLSRWTDFLKSDGEKEWRKRDEEFETVVKTREELLRLWEEGWSCLFVTLNNLTENDLNSTVYIRNQGMSVVDAINRQLCHYAYHVGQIVFAGKIFVEKEWKSLSIAKNQSASYNSEKFSQEKGMRHFTDEYLKKKE